MYLLYQICTKPPPIFGEGFSVLVYLLSAAICASVSPSATSAAIASALSCAVCASAARRSASAASCSIRCASICSISSAVSGTVVCSPVEQSTIIFVRVSVIVFLSCYAVVTVAPPLPAVTMYRDAVEPSTIAYPHISILETGDVELLFPSKTERPLPVEE